MLTLHKVNLFVYCAIYVNIFSEENIYMARSVVQHVWGNLLVILQNVELPKMVAAKLLNCRAGPARQENTQKC